MSQAIIAQAGPILEIIRDNDNEPVWANLHGKQLRYCGLSPENRPIFAGIIELNPEFSQAVLDNMHTNRSINKKHVDMLADDMLNNRWLFTGEPMIFDFNGFTTDSQHRNTAYLRACEKNKAPVKGITMLAVVGVSPSSMLVLDSGKKRSVVDSARISESHLRDDSRSPITPQHQQIIKAASKTDGSYSVSALVDLVKKYADPLEYVLISGEKGKSCYCKYPIIRAVIFLACLEYRNQYNVLKKIDEFKHWLDSSYDAKNFSNEEVFSDFYGFDYTNTRAWALCLRHEVEETHKNKQYGGTNRREFKIKATKAIRSFIQGLPGPGTNNLGGRKPIPVVISPEEEFSANFDSINEWNDDSYCSIFQILSDD
jgi:hypothetical protein